MPPKEKLTREDIVMGAFEILRTKGYEALNARDLAESLGCSTMPLFRHFQGMEEIKKAAIDIAVERYSEYLDRGFEHEKAYKGAGMEFIRFAKEEPKLFELLFMTSDAPLPEKDPNEKRIAMEATLASGLSPKAAQKLIGEMGIFSYGIAAMLAKGVKRFEDEEIGEMMTDVFSALCVRLKKEDE